jgi:Fe2+ or Zn2+ uptake regulation protein
MEINQTLHSQGLHVTRQRKLVLEILKQSQNHLDAGAIFFEAKKKDDRISLATVYRTLDLLKKAGLVEENSLGEDHGHFEATHEIQHYHFTCIHCGKVIELQTGKIQDVVRKTGELQGLKVTDIQLFLRGYCSDCQTKVMQS